MVGKMNLSELGIIEKIRRQSRTASPELLVGIGDDCAVIKRGGGLVELVTTDTLVEHVHFDRAWHSPELLGRKAAAVNLSDVAAMGGRPRYCLLSLALPSDFTEAWLEQFLAGFLACLTEQGTLLIGGDTVKSASGHIISVTVMGEAAADQILLRSAARPGDLIMVSGMLGNAAAGLEICRRGPAAAKADWQELVAAHLDPKPETGLGLVLAESGLVNGMMDLSDGLATDLAHLCAESGVGAEIAEHSLPITAGLRDAAASLGCDPMAWALSGGEDYRLLFTVPAADCEKLRELIHRRLARDIFRVGIMVEGEGVVLLTGSNRRDISYQGYDHFKIDNGAGKLLGAPGPGR
jgi:thiamine-monophosphate kinase